ncbi:hypothetical protein B0I72DRAFT_140145 [Yarrowia lipolytica]|uniref:Uncharacterized protein n=1 Tax=Yarrowia lipolytica TaxID=4952 RepID=A0A371C6S3_YARLL|nr:hypothetical protein BKA91DRAFT_131603 [Yarrowia lipolytica]KAE8174309.1 hypothetical protein BKA90DRAFT_134267 [Yarrowia lipolytica]RDW25985.1 hypothetical protein B0I71DRAFT_131611 [Yarrowia lipolytica]RDW31244.1 hypothetical protein B0I72DRAFT_140145 [Yarrowia lipolytica]RDW40207.1 hypothetical protein B0I73DRAFT_130697 [Yarrowia lipolytica]
MLRNQPLPAALLIACGAVSVVSFLTALSLAQTQLSPTRVELRNLVPCHNKRDMSATSSGSQRTSEEQLCGRLKPFLLHVQTLVVRGMH